MTSSGSSSEGPERELVESGSDFIVALRSREGLDERLYERLEQALRHCGEQWRDSQCIPRLAVNLLVDLQPAMLSAADAYGPGERDRIIDRAIRIGGLVRNTVAI